MNSNTISRARNADIAAKNEEAQQDQTASAADRFHITDERGVNRFLKKIADIDAERTWVKMQAQEGCQRSGEAGAAGVESRLCGVTVVIWEKPTPRTLEISQAACSPRFQ